jgi:pimeloyl-ACP methyl ester carboxylesterase
VDIAKVNGVELEYETKGSGDPVLLISPVLPDGFLPLLSEPALVDHHRLIRYHRRGWAGSTRTERPASIADHAADAGALLAHLGVRRAHVAGHSSGGPIALQLALDDPGVVHTLVLLEPLLLHVPAAQVLLQRAAPAIEAHAAGDPHTAVLTFLSVVSGLEPETCRAVIDGRIPDCVAQSAREVDTLFGVELPAVGAWTFGLKQARSISQPVLSVSGSETDRLWLEVADLLRSWFPQIEELCVSGVGHLLHIQEPEPVARGLAGFFARHPVKDTATAVAAHGRDPRSAATSGASVAG